MDKIETLANDPQIASILASFEKRQQDFIQQIIEIQQIPAPTFSEKKRAEYVESQFKKIGLSAVYQDEQHNVFGLIKGTQSNRYPPLILTAHMDTVFQKDTDLSISESGPYLYGPGIGDNSTGVAGLLQLAEIIIKFKISTKSDIWIICNVGEEGMGNLNGMRVVVSHFGNNVNYIVVEGGLYGQISHQAIGVKRYRLEVSGPGGHSWGSFGQVSAIHELGNLISTIDAIKVPPIPKTTYNVGVIEGGTTVNSIASFASMLLDLRSENAQKLNFLIDSIFSIVESRQKKADQEGCDITFRMIEVGDRPAGAIDRNHDLVKLATSALIAVGCTKISYIAGSTDANIPLSFNIPTVCIGLTVSGNSHRLDEFIDPSYLPLGMQQLFLLTMAAAEKN